MQELINIKTTISFLRFVLFRKGEQRVFLKLVKKKSKKTWVQLANIIFKSRSSIFAYYQERVSIPENVYFILNKFYKNPFYVTYKNGEYYSHVIKQFPPLTPTLAEFLGIIYGDGYIGKNPYTFVISSHTVLDKYHIDYMKKQFTKLFGLNLTSYNQRNQHYLRIYSKSFVDWLHTTYQFPIGKKKNKLKIPDDIIKQKSLLVPFLRGVYDTDGTFCRHHKSGGGIVEFSSASKNFREEIATSLEHLGFKVSRGRKSVTIYDKQKIMLFFKLVKPNNKKHVIKYEIFKRTGQVPLTKLLMHRWSNG